MEKFKFSLKLKEAILKRKVGQQPTVIIDGEESKVRCPVFVGVGTGDIPCLIEKNNKTGNAGYNVVAVSFDDRNEEEKSWICIRPVLIEKAVGFFLKSNQMNEMAKDCNNVTSFPATGKGKPDFQAGNTYIEVKVSMPMSYKSGGLMWLNFTSAIEQILKYHDKSGDGKRIVLLAICQHGTGHIQAMPDGRTKEELEKAASMGIEFWMAETKTGQDGISLMSYQNVTDNLLGRLAT